MDRSERSLESSAPGLPVPRSTRAVTNRVVPSSGRPTALSSGPDALGLLRAFRRRWAVAIFGGLAAAAIAGVAAYYLVPPPRYTARSLVRVASLPAKIIFQTNESVTEYRTYQRTQATLAKGRTVLAAALRDPEITKLKLKLPETDSVAWLDREVKIDFPGGSEVMTFTMSGEDPKAVTALVNAVTDAYLKEVVAVERSDRIARFDNLKTLKDKLQDELRARRKDFRVSVEQVGPADKQSAANREQSSMDQLNLVKMDLRATQVELRKAEMQIRILEARHEHSVMVPGASNPPARGAVEDPTLARLTQERDDLRSRAASLARLTTRPGDPSVRHVLAKLEAAQAALEKRTEELRRDPAYSASVGSSRGGDSALLDAKALRAVLAEQEKTLREQANALQAEVKITNGKSLDLHWLEDEIALLEGTAKTVGAEVEALNVELTAPPRIKLIERAEAPIISDPLRKYKIGGIAALSLFGLFVAGVTFAEYQIRRVGTTEELSLGLGIRLIGALPLQPPPQQRSEAWTRRLVEAVDAVRTMLLHADRDEPARVLMVVSPDKGEGKTTLSCHLAASLARAGRKTLLIDADLRNPSAHRALAIPPGAGLCEVLRGEAEAVDATWAAGSPGLDFLPAGSLDENSLRGLADGRLARVLADLRGRYDYLVIDSAPLLLVPDSLMIAQHADASVFAVLREVSRVPRVYAAYEKLELLGVRVVGAVMAGVRDANGTYAYTYGHGYGSAVKSESGGKVGHAS